VGNKPVVNLPIYTWAVQNRWNLAEAEIIEDLIDAKSKINTLNSIYIHPEDYVALLRYIEQVDVEMDWTTDQVLGEDDKAFRGVRIRRDVNQPKGIVVVTGSHGTVVLSGIS